MQAPLPVKLDFGLLFLSEAAGGAVPPLGGKVGLKPASDLFPECLFFGREPEIHG